MTEIQKLWGSWGNDIIFTFQRSPEYGSFVRSKSWDYTKHKTLLSSPKLEGTTENLKTITFSLNVWNIIFKNVKTNAAQRAIRSTGIAKVTGNNFGIYGSPQNITSLLTDIPLLLKYLNDQANSFISYPLIIGNQYEGEFVLESISENIKHYADGTIKNDKIQLSFLEDKTSLKRT